MGQMERLREHNEARQSIAEGFLLESGYFVRCRHEMLVNNEPYDDQKRHAMAMATNYVKSHEDFDREEMLLAVSDTVMENGYCDQCENGYDGGEDFDGERDG